jgi:hypothetical protein
VTEWLKIGSAIVRLDDIAAVQYADVSRPTAEIFTYFRGGHPYVALDEEAIALWHWWAGIAIDVLAEEEPLHRRAKLVD